MLYEVITPKELMSSSDILTIKQAIQAIKIVVYIVISTSETKKSEVTLRSFNIFCDPEIYFVVLPRRWDSMLSINISYNFV